MSNDLDFKIRQIHAALNEMKTADLSSIAVEQGRTSDSFYVSVDFNEGTDDAKLANVVTLLVNNIACIKDHLKVWCEKHSTKFNGEVLINSNRSVALIHDLWNLNKHLELNGPSRSGYKPRLIELRRYLVVSGGTSANSVAIYSHDPKTGQMTTHTSGDGSVELEIGATIVDENGTVLGDFEAVCKEAIQAWRDELFKSGVQLP